MTKARTSESQWAKYLDLAAKLEGHMPGTGDAEADKFHNAGSYANFVETPETTDEQWAEAFWTAYYS
jgi:hypothetical protein